jgi:hypothetical protein
MNQIIRPKGAVPTDGTAWTIERVEHGRGTKCVLWRVWNPKHTAYVVFHHKGEADVFCGVANVNSEGM